MQVRFTARLPAELSDRLEFWAKEAGCSKNDMLIEACRMYGDLKAAHEPGSYLPQWAVQQIRGISGDLQTRINHRSNQLLSSMAIQLTVLQYLIADNLEVSSAALAEYTAQAVEHLKTNNRLFRMDELV